MPELQFDPILHVYSLNGQRLPSVTQIMEDVGIIDYSSIPGETRERALERGRLVHEATALDDEDDLDEESLPESLAPYLQAWRKFRAATSFTPRLIEHRSHHQYGFAGTLDREGDITWEGKRIPCLLDIKTGIAQLWVRWQLAAYAAFFPDSATKRRLCVELRRDASFRLHWFAPADYFTDFNTFCAFLTTMRCKSMPKEIR